tara:strand:- start:21536 stop:21739 length:204 start_codon:yes stop_codon:yes gene_type:complete
MKGLIGLAFMALAGVLIIKFIQAVKVGDRLQRKNWHYRKDGFVFYILLFIFGFFMLLGQFLGSGPWW